VSRGTGFRLCHFGELRAKTGTTDQGSWLISYDPFFQTTVWVEEADKPKTDVLPPKARTAKELSERVWEWLRNREFLADFWGVLRGYSRLPQREMIEFDIGFACKN
ncbi:MAG: hypothetical protein R6X14_00220, partial [bacterium]